MSIDREEYRADIDRTRRTLHDLGERLQDVALDVNHGRSANVAVTVAAREAAAQATAAAGLVQQLDGHLADTASRTLDLVDRVAAIEQATEARHAQVVRVLEKVGDVLEHAVVIPAGGLADALDRTAAHAAAPTRTSDAPAPPAPRTTIADDGTSTKLTLAARTRDIVLRGLYRDLGDSDEFRPNLRRVLPPLLIQTAEDCADITSLDHQDARDETARGTRLYGAARDLLAGSVLRLDDPDPKVRGGDLHWLTTGGRAEIAAQLTDSPDQPGDALQVMADLAAIDAHAVMIRMAARATDGTTFDAPSMVNPAPAVRS